MENSKKQIPHDQVERARQVDLLNYLREYNPGELVRKSGETYCTKTHDSLIISNGKWHWFSHGIGGTSALDYLIKVEGMQFQDAIEQILGRVAFEKKPAFSTSSAMVTAKKDFVLPPKNFSNKRAYNYLLSRGISRNVIDFCVKTNRFYEDSKYHNAIFVGFDDTNTPRYAMKRSTMGASFKGEVSGSEKQFSFAIPAENGNGKSNVLHVFEAAIDLLSFATMAEIAGRNWQAHHLLSLAGIYAPGKNAETVKVPVSLDRFLASHPEVDRIILRLDNDEVGKAAAEALEATLGEKYQVRTILPPEGKDYNEMLQNRLGLSPTKENRNANSSPER